MLSGIPSLQTLSAQPSGKDNLVSKSDNPEDFSQHLGANSKGTSEPEQSDSPDTIELETQPPILDRAAGSDEDTIAIDDENSDAELELISAKQQPELLDTQKTFDQLRFNQLVNTLDLKLPRFSDDRSAQVAIPELASQSDKPEPTSRIATASELLLSTSDIPTRSTKPVTKLNIVTGSELLVPPTDAADMSDKPVSTSNIIKASEPQVPPFEVATAPPKLVPTSEVVAAFELQVPISKVTVEPELQVPRPEIAVEPELQVPRSEIVVELEMQMPRSEFTNKVEMLVPAPKNSTVSEMLEPNTKMLNDTKLMVPPSEIGDAQALPNTILPSVNQVLNGSESGIFNAVGPALSLVGGLIRDSKTVRDLSAKVDATPATKLQSFVEGRSTTAVQNSSVQVERPVQSNLALPQERSSTIDTDLEKTLRSFDEKKPSVSATVDPSSQKLSVEAPVASLSQPSQTLVRAIQENSNWTKVLSSSSVQFDQTAKVDGTVLQKLDIHINLAALGKLDVKLRLQQGELQVQIRTDSEQAYKMLCVDQDALANTIKGLGYKVDNIAISGPRSDSGFQMNSNSQMQGQQQSAEHQYQNEKSGQRANREFIPMRDANNDIQSPSSIVERSASDVNVI